MSESKSFYQTPVPEKYDGVLGWLITYDHKRIGLMYLAALMTWFVSGMTRGFLIRIELMAIGETILNATIYNSFFTLHGVVLIFLFIIPGIPAVFILCAV
jgi:cytochrome c oxidase subunit 1